MEELMELLDEYDIEFTWVNKFAVGVIDPYKNVIKINLYLLIAETIMHEMMHFQSPQLSEVDIEKLARAKIQQMTVNEIKRMVDYTVAVRRRNGEKE